jgi:hypothetical protein
MCCCVGTWCMLGRSEDVKLENVLELQWNYRCELPRLYKDEVILRTDDTCRKLFPATGVKMFDESANVC